MKKLLTATLFGGIIAAAATPAFAGNGTAFTTREACLAGIETAQLYVPSAMANRSVSSTPSVGFRHAGISGKVCVLEHTSMPRSSNGHTAGWWWVAIDGGYLMTNGSAYRDSRCENAIREVAQRPQEVAECTNCHQQPATLQPAPVQVAQVPTPAPVQVGIIAAPAPQQPVYQQQVVYRAPAQLAFIPVGPMPAAGSVYVGGNTYLNNYQQASAPVFGGETRPPLPNPTPLPPTDFGGVTIPGLPGPVTGGFSGVTNPSVPGPVPGPGGGLLPPNNNGGVGAPLPGPTNNGGNFNNTFVGGLGAPLPGPVNNGGNFGNNFGGTTFGLQGPSSNSVVVSTTTVVGGIQAPLPGGTTVLIPGFGGQTF